jgi:hypothetical protein
VPTESETDSNEGLRRVNLDEIDRHLAVGNQLVDIKTGRTYVRGKLGGSFLERDEDARFIVLRGAAPQEWVGMCSDARRDGPSRLLKASQLIASGHGSDYARPRPNVLPATPVLWQTE